MLTKTEINKRLIRLRNLERLYKIARKAVDPLRKKILFLKRKIKLLENKVGDLTKNNEDQKLRIEELEKMLFKEKRKKKESQKKKKKQTRKTSSYRRPIPTENDITDVKRIPIDKCPDCESILIKKKDVVRYVEDIILPSLENVFKSVLKLIIESGYCPKCKKRVTAIPVTKHTVTLGRNIRMFTSYLNVVMRLTYSQIREMLNRLYRIDISKGEITNILEKEAILLEEENRKIISNIRGDPGAHYDETVWKVSHGEQGNYCWVMTGTQNPQAAFLIGQSRGNGNIDKLKGDSNHVGITDGYGAYKNKFGKHQLCWAHPHRKLRDLKNSDDIRDEMRKHIERLYEGFNKIREKGELEKAKPFDKFKRKEVKQKLIKELRCLMKLKDKEPKKLRNIKNHLRKEAEKYFTFLDVEANIPLDNNKAERSVRHLVLKRKSCFGSKTQKGADMLSTLATVLLSLTWSKVDDFFGAYRKMTPVEILQ